MSQHLRCPACGKSYVIEGPAPASILCTACGGRIPILNDLNAEEGTGEPSIMEAPENPWTTVTTTDLQAMTSQAAAQPMRTPASASPPRIGGQLTAPARRNRPPAWIIVGAVVAACMIYGAGWFSSRLLELRSFQSHTKVSAEEAQRDADLLAIKSEAERLVIAGKLAEAHAKYRELQRLALGYNTKDPILWDMIDRARVDQDNVYNLLLKKQDAAFAGPTTAPATQPAPQVVQAQPPSYAPGQSPYLKDYPNGNVPPTSAALPTTLPTTQPAQANAAPTTQPTSAAPADLAGGPTSRPALVFVPATQPISPDVAATLIDDEQIGQAIKRGTEFVLSQYVNGEIPPIANLSEGKRRGLDILGVYSLLQISQATKDPRLDIKGPLMTEMLEHIKAYDLNADVNGPFEPITYARSLRAAALSVYNRPEDRKALQADVDWLVNAAESGSYTYDDRYSHRHLAVPGAHAEAPHHAKSAFAMNNEPGALLPTLLDTASDDPKPAVIPIDGYHDPRTGAEMIVPRIYILPPPVLPPPQNYPPSTYPQPPGTLQMPGAANSGSGWNPVPPVNAPPPPSLMRFFPWDNSNSQYGLLGVWSGAEVGAEVPQQYWRDVERHWLDCELKNGTWTYRPNEMEGSLAMTCGGIASLLVTHDYIQAQAFTGAVGREPYPRPLAIALQWLEQGDNCLNTPNKQTHYMGYDVYGIERVGLASGLKYFGRHDWYRELAYHIVKMQWPNGSWGASQDGPDNLVDTSYMLLFLSRGRHPILMNKLRFEGAWDNRPRDIANLARVATHETERPLNWQIVSLDRDWFDWMDCPVLYLASQKPPQFTDEQFSKLRQFAEAGGLIFTQADAGSENLTKWVAQTLAPKIAPGHELQTLADSDPIFSLHYPIRTPHPKLMAVSNGSRLLLIHSPTDISIFWQQRSEKLHRELYRLGMNIFFYAAGKGDLRNRLSSPYIPEPPAVQGEEIHVARVKYAGNWDPEPYAWTRFARYFQGKDGHAIKADPMDFQNLNVGSASLAALTGNANHEFTEAEIAAVRAYVEGGGVLLIDSCGGSSAFNQSVQFLLGKAFPSSSPADLPADHPLLAGLGRDGKSAGQPRPRPFVVEKMKENIPHVQMLSAGKGAVIVSQLDLTTGLLGTNTWEILGYEPQACTRFMENLVIWTHSR